MDLFHSSNRDDQREGAETSFQLWSTELYDRDGETVKRFGFHNLGRLSLATFLMDAQENPALVQAIMCHAKMDMTLYYSHSRRNAKPAAQEKVLQHPTS